MPYGNNNYGKDVTPYVGVWIEIGEHQGQGVSVAGHPLCGGVD